MSNLEQFSAPRVSLSVLAFDEDNICLMIMEMVK